MIEIKNTEVLESLLIHPAHPNLIKLMIWFCNKYLWAVVLTGGFEERDYASVHSTIPFRGMDIRSRIYKNPQEVADDVNKYWEYDSKRPEKKCAKYHNSGRGNHIHLQVHDNTVYRR